MATESEARPPPLAELLRQHERFELVRELGRGGMGVVYEAIDHERDLRVALKTLRNLEPASLFRFKREFRALADAVHPNLVSLYELLELGGQWLFTMELIDGLDYLSYLRGGAPSDPAAEQPTATGQLPLASPSLGQPESTHPTQPSQPTPDPGDTVVSPPADPERVYATLPQLAAALIALHDTGHLHRDIKPSNIMVTEEGRVVLLDFGVITDVTRVRSRRDGFVGTPRYAAPEQSRSDGTAGPASDWYSVGVILYEALTGRRLFPGSAQQIIDAKQTLDPDPPSAHNPDVDPVLDDLCVRLLERQPERRPHGAEILALLDQARSARNKPPPTIATTESGQLFGREDELDRLRAAFDDVRGGQGRSVLVGGRSGIGKTALAHHFLSEVMADPHALVLTGRCYERESVPYQAIDTLVDSLCQFLLEQARHKADALMPVDVQSLARAFPVLNRVDAVLNAPTRARAPASDPQELRRRAFAALRELIVRLAERRPLVVFIDDLQWGDADSVPFVASLMAPPAAPLLFLASYRSEESDSSPFLAALRAELAADSDGPSRFQELALERLPEAEARALAETLLAASDRSADLAEEVTHEAGGNPFLVTEFVQFLASRPAPSDLSQLDLAAMIVARTRALTPGARRLLEVVAVAGNPVAQEVVQRAVGLGDVTPRVLAELRAARMVRTTGSRAYDRVEIYHDRIREVVVAGLSEVDLRAHHLGLARGLAASEHPDPEALATHYAAAGEPATALRYATAAADLAADTLAFERAATMYRLALSLTPADDQQRGPLGRKLGDALVYAGRGVEAAAAYLDATAFSSRKDALDLQVRAGNELLRNGRIEEGVATLRPALADAGIAMAKSPRRLLLAVALGRAELRLRGLRFRPTPVDEVAPQELTRIEALAAASGGLGMADILRGAHIQTRHLLAALRCGEPLRVGRALVYESAFTAVAGPKSRSRNRRILTTLHGLAEETGEPFLEALHAGMSALAAYQCGEWRACRIDAERGEEILRAHCRGVAWELTSLQLYRVWALCWLGEFPQLAERVRRYVREARERGDVYAEVSLSTGLPSFLGLVADEPEATRARSEEAFARWSRSGYHLQHYWAQLGFVNCDLYAGDADAALRRIVDNWPLMRRSFILGISMVGAEFTNLRARSVLALAAAGRAGPRQARREVRRFAGHRLGWCRPATELLRAGLSSLRGDDADAIRRLRIAEEGFRKYEMAAHAAVARRLRGQLMSGDRGQVLHDAGDAELTALGVKNPDRMSRFLAPGIGDHGARLLPGAD